MGAIFCLYLHLHILFKIHYQLEQWHTSLSLWHFILYCSISISTIVQIPNQLKFYSWVESYSVSISMFCLNLMTNLNEQWHTNISLSLYSTPSPPFFSNPKLTQFLFTGTHTLSLSPFLILSPTSLFHTLSYPVSISIFLQIQICLKLINNTNLSLRHFILCFFHIHLHYCSNLQLTQFPLMRHRGSSSVSISTLCFNLINSFV